MSYVIQQSTARDQGKCRRVICCGLDDPIANYTSAREEGDVYIGQEFEEIIPELGDTWEARDCMRVYYSDISQADADLQAMVAAEDCANDTFNGDDEGFFWNEGQICQTLCNSGNHFNVVVPARLFRAKTQAEANALAQAYCQQEARKLVLCIAGDLPGACVDEYYDESLQIESTGVPISASLVDGELPPGLTLTLSGDEILIQGTPTTCGNYVFTVNCIDDNGNVATRTTSIGVLEITTTSPLTGAILNQPFEVQYEACGGSGQYKWELVSGTLPTGLTLEETGRLHGTPTVVDTYNFRVRVIDGEEAEEPPDDPGVTPVALQAFFVTVPQYGSRPATVIFQDRSLGANIISWFWEFGDGQTSNERNPTHEYPDDGCTGYQVQLTISNGSVTDTIIRTLPFRQALLQIASFNLADWTDCSALGSAASGVDWTGTIGGRGLEPFELLGNVCTWQGSGTNADDIILTAKIVKDTVNEQYIMVVTAKNVTPGGIVTEIEIWRGEKAFDPVASNQHPIGTYTKSSGCVAKATVDIEYYT